MGGPAHHVALLSSRLDPERYETLLVAGRVGRGEESLADLAEDNGVHLELVDSLGPEIRPDCDLRALRELGRITRSFGPDIVHTHTAKAGVLGRLAARLSTRKPVVVHTYHGHTLEGYFGPAQNAIYRSIERRLASGTDCLVGVSQATVDDLVRLRIAPPGRFRVIPVGLDLSRFAQPTESDRAGFRAEIRARPDDLVVTFVGRLVRIKRVDVLLNATARARELGARVVLVVVGDGVLRAELERLASELGIAASVRFLGYRRDLARIAAGSDCAVLASDNEGTPVSLIEAAAAGLPSVATDVGGVADVVAPDAGILVPPRSPEALARGMAELADNGPRMREMGVRAREHVTRRFSVDRLVADVTALYDELLGR